MTRLSADKDYANAINRPKFFLTLIEQIKYPWKFRLSVATTWERPIGGSISNSGETIEITVSGWDKFQIEARSLVHVWAYSKSSVQYMVPVLMGLTAAAVLTVKAILAY